MAIDGLLIPERNSVQEQRPSNSAASEAVIVEPDCMEVFIFKSQEKLKGRNVVFLIPAALIRNLFHRSPLIRLPTLATVLRVV
jgi:hypothetical protein